MDKTAPKTSLIAVGTSAPIRPLLALLAPVLLSACGSGDAEGPDARIVQELDSVVVAAAEMGFSGQVLVTTRGAVVLHRGYGLADDSSGTPVDTSTVFPVGSVTKRFTRVAVHRLEESGLLSTADPISEYLPGFPAEKRSITIDQLLRHTSGLGTYHDDSGDHQPMSREEAMERIGGQRLRFEPGGGRGYSNSGYTLLAAVVERASRRPFEAFLREEIFEPAGMDRTGFHGDGRWSDDEVARGYGMRVFRGNAPHRWPSTTWALKGAGGVVAPASDLLRFIEALREGRIVGEKALRRLYPDGQPHLHYAGGDDFGFVTEVMELDHGEHVVIVQTNRGFGFEWLPPALAAVVRGEPLDGREGSGQPDDPPRSGVANDPDPVPTEGGGLPDSPRGRAANWLVTALEDGSAEALREFVELRLAPGTVGGGSTEPYAALLEELAARVEAEGVQGLRPVSEFSFRLDLGDDEPLLVRIAPEPPHLIEELRIGG